MQPEIRGLSHLPGVQSIYCVGRNYMEHARELGNPVPDQPVIFTKPRTSVIQDGGQVLIPRQTSLVHHEVEMVAAVGRELKNATRQQAEQAIAGYGIGIDLTARDIQQQLKERSHPWDLAKGMDTFAPVSAFLPAGKAGSHRSLHLSLTRNGQTVQQGHTGEMLFGVEDLLAFLSTYFTLMPGDLLFTGTPEGVGPVTEGDRLHAVLSGEQGELASLSVSVAGDNGSGRLA